MGPRRLARQAVDKISGSRPRPWHLLSTTETLITTNTPPKLGISACNDGSEASDTSRTHFADPLVDSDTRGAKKNGLKLINQNLRLTTTNETRGRKPILTEGYVRQLERMILGGVSMIELLPSSFWPMRSILRSLHAQSEELFETSITGAVWLVRRFIWLLISLLRGSSLPRRC